MTSDKRQWRFFTTVTVSDHHIRDHWCWERLDSTREVVAQGAGFTTLPAALRDAKRNGFAGDTEAWERLIVPRRCEDWGPDDTHELQRWLIQRLPELDDVEEKRT